MNKSEVAVGTAQVDEAVVQSVLQGQTNEFEKIVRKYNERLFKVGLGYLKDVEDVEDAMQQTYVKAFLNLKNFKARSSFSTWLTRIMINECLMALRLEQRKSGKEFQLSRVPAKAAANNASIENKLIEEEMKITLEKAIMKLPENFRTIYMMRIVEELSTEETAACLQISMQNVKVRLHRSKEALKENLFQMAEGIELFGYHLTRCNSLTGRVMQQIRSIS